MKTALLFLALAAPLIAQETRPTREAPDPTNEGGRVKLERIWTFIQERYDKDGNGRVTVAEYTRGEIQFANYDIDHDGVLTETDFPDESWYNGFGPGVAFEADRDRNREVTAQEWEAYLDKLDADKNGEMTQEEFGNMYSPVMAARMSIVALSFDQDMDGKVTRADYVMLFSDLDRNKDGVLAGDELQTKVGVGDRPSRPAPAIGEVAPDFELPLADDAERTVRLSSFKNKKPVALIFGSYT
jgi:Ca2+-binding EF-hand superfamily protein